MTRYTRIGLTGANGTIGRVLLAGLGAEYEFKAFTRRPVDFPATIVNFDRAAEVEGAFEGLEAVIHLAADPSPSASWESVRDHNLGHHPVLESSAYPRHQSTRGKVYRGQHRT